MAYYASSPPDPRLAITNPAEFMKQMADWNQYLKEAQALAPIIAKIPGIYAVPGISGAALREATNYYHGTIDTGEEIKKQANTITTAYNSTIETAQNIQTGMSMLPFILVGGALLLTMSRR